MRCKLAFWVIFFKVLQQICIQKLESGLLDKSSIFEVGRDTLPSILDITELISDVKAVKKKNLLLLGRALNTIGLRLNLALIIALS